VNYTVRTRIEIDAPASVVWELLVDLDQYHRWNPFIVRAKGRIAPGARVEVSPQLTARRSTTFWPNVTAYAEGSEFAWTGVIGHRWLAQGEHLFRLHPLGADRVLVEHDEVFFGIAAPLVGLLAGKLTERGFDAMNGALKREAEARLHA
jgi:hypothetical protein